MIVMDSVIAEWAQIIFRIAMLVGGCETTVAAEVAAESPGNRGLPSSARRQCKSPQMQMAERRNCLQRRPAFRPFDLLPLRNNYTPTTFFIFPSTLPFFRLIALLPDSLGLVFSVE